MAVKTQVMAPAAPPRGSSPALNEPDRWSIFILVILVGLTFIPVLQLWIGIYGDWAFHAVFTEQMRLKGSPSVPHFGYHGLLVAVQKALEFITREARAFSSEELRQTVIDPPSHIPSVVAVGQYYAMASVVAGLVLAEVMALVLWFAFRRCLSQLRWADGEAGSIAAIALTLAVLFAGPIAALQRLDGRMYLGYIGLNVWHSPTVLLAKPLAVLCFFYAAGIFSPSPGTPGEGRGGARTTRGSVIASIAGGAALTILSTLAKPNYTLCLLPGLALFVPVAWFMRLKIRWMALIFGLVLPAVGVLAWQYYFTYRQAGIRPNRIIFAPLLAMFLLSNKYLLWKFLLSIAFPAVVSLLFIHRTLRDRRMLLAWLIFGCGAGWMYLAAEEVGPGDGNFTWGAQIALFVLFVETVLFLLRQNRDVSGFRLAGRVTLCAAVFLLHVGFGVAYHIRVLNMLGKPWQGWW